VLVNSVLITRTALFDHQLHNVINQPFTSTLCFDCPLPLPFKSRMLSCCGRHFDICRYIYFYSLFHSIHCFRVVLYTFSQVL